MATFLRAVAVAALALAAPAGWADETPLAAIRQAGVIKVGTTGDYKPFSYRAADGELVGADIDMAKDLATSLGVKAEFVMTSWATLLDDFRSGKFDVAVGGITVTPRGRRPEIFRLPTSATANVRSCDVRTRTNMSRSRRSTAAWSR